MPGAGNSHRPHEPAHRGGHLRPDPKEPALKRTGHCVIVFVALDEAGQPVPVPPWTPVTDTDRALQAYALRLVELRKLMDAELESHLDQLEQSTAGSITLSG